MTAQPIILKKYPKNLQIRLSTNGFSKKEVEKLRELLSLQLGEYFVIGTDKAHQNQYIIIGSNAAARAYFNAIDNLVPQCMSRKFRWRDDECEFYNNKLVLHESRNKTTLEKEFKLMEALYIHNKLTIGQISDICNWKCNNKINHNIPIVGISRYLDILKKHGLIKKGEFIFHVGRVFEITKKGIQYFNKHFKNKNLKQLLFSYIPLAKSKHGPK